MPPNTHIFFIKDLKIIYLEAFHLSHHGKELINWGFGDDLAYCARIDITDIVPDFKERSDQGPPHPSLLSLPAGRQKVRIA